MLAIGGAIGTGLFLGSGRAIHLAGPSIIFAYLITGVICFFIMRALGELLLSNLNHHSFIDFVEDYLGDRAAFITGWTYWFCWLSLAMADLTAVGLYMQYWIPWLPQWIPALLVLIVLLLMNLTAVKHFGEMEFWFALIKVIAIISLTIIGIIMMLQVLLQMLASPPLAICGITEDGSRTERWALSYHSKWLYLLSQA